MKSNSILLLLIILISGCNISNSSENRPANSNEPEIVGVWERQYEGLPIATEIITVSDTSIIYRNYNELPCHEDPNDPSVCFDSLMISFKRVEFIDDTIISSNGIKIVDTDTLELNVLDTLVYVLTEDTLKLVNHFSNISENAIFLRTQE